MTFESVREALERNQVAIHFIAVVAAAAVAFASRSQRCEIAAGGDAPPPSGVDGAAAGLSRASQW